MSNPREKATMEKLVQDIDNYVVHKEELESLKKSVDKFNANIKQSMADLNVESFEGTDVTANIVIQHRESMDEDKALSIILANTAVAELPGLVKTKQYIDMDVLEKALYAGDIPKNVVAKLNTCRDVKEITTLRITKKRG